jgi:putative methyltransferase (TIGR04325 family)
MSAAPRHPMKALIPRPLRRWLRRMLRGAVYSGDYASWDAAVAASRGYADTAIFEKTLAAARTVRDGGAAWERDSVLFTEPAPNRPVLEGLQRIAAAHDGRLNLVDFGGALGSTWWQHRTWLASLRETRWSVVEQEQLVAAGKREFTTGPLRFYATLTEACAAEKPDAVLLSSVLPYLRDPHALLAEIRRSGVRHLLIDRTGFVTRGRDRLTVQQVPPEIYPASYPCWFFDRATLLAPFAADWRVVAEWETEDDVDIDAQHRGLMLEKILPA